jgi:hypothetical protein
VSGPSLLLLVDRVRAELVGRGHVPTAVLDESATVNVQALWAQGAGDVYLRARLAYVLRQLGQHVQPSGAVHDARIALGEYETFLALEQRAAA